MGLRLTSTTDNSSAVPVGSGIALRVWSAQQKRMNKLRNGALDTKFSNVHSHSVGDRVFIFPARATDVKAREKERTRKI